MEQMIFGLIVTLLCIVCGTLIIIKRMQLRAEREEREKEAIRTHTERIIDDEYRVAYEEEYARRVDAEFRESVKDRELKRARDLLAKFKLSALEDAEKRYVEVHQ